MNYTRKYFDPQGNRRAADDPGDVAFHPNPAKPEELYVFASKVILAVNVARATGRALLVSGEPGCGKSSLARSAAAVLRWRYYARTVTSRTQAADLQWTFDALRRLNDASKQNATLRDDRHYVDPGPLWWAFDPASARQRGNQREPEVAHADDPGQSFGSDAGAVVLIDEIDKADPDVPNDLLEPFDRKTFTVRETGDPIVATREVLMVLTTNRERQLPRAFIRRCVTLELAEPTAAWLANIATQRYGANPLHTGVAEEVMALRKAAKRAGIREPSTAEYLDAVTALRQLEAKSGSNDWEEVKRALLWKSDATFPKGTPAGGTGE